MFDKSPRKGKQSRFPKDESRVAAATDYKGHCAEIS